MAKGRYGVHGGQYIPETLMDEVLKLEKAYEFYKNDPAFIDKRTFMETEFSKQNNASFGYERFDYLYLEDTLPDTDRILLTHKKISEFFEEK